MQVEMPMTRLHAPVRLDACGRRRDLKACVRALMGGHAGLPRLARHHLELGRKTAEAVCDISEHRPPRRRQLVVSARPIPFRQVAAIVC
jgi:hypothetical protein